MALARPLGLSCLAFDPYITEQAPTVANVELVQLDDLLVRSDYVCVCCPLNETTYHLIGEHELDRMKPSAFLINVARGPIVDQVALTKALQSGDIKGAGLDVFEREPVRPRRSSLGVPKRNTGTAFTRVDRRIGTRDRHVQPEQRHRSFEQEASRAHLEPASTKTSEATGLV